MIGERGAIYVCARTACTLAHTLSALQSARASMLLSKVVPRSHATHGYTKSVSADASEAQKSQKCARWRACSALSAHFWPLQLSKLVHMCSVRILVLEIVRARVV